MPPLQIIEFAPAKVNLTLHVLGQRPDGYHLLDSLVVFCSVGDRVTVQHAPDLGLTITGPWAHMLPVGADNLVLRAARLLKADRCAAIVLEKNLPLSSGMGGGSADAAATLRVLSRLWNVPLPDAVAVLSLGADVPVCLGMRAARMRGIGDQVETVPALPESHLVLVNPGLAVPTPAVFGALSDKHNQPMPDTLPDWNDAADLGTWLTSQRNDLETPARAMAPAIDAVLAALAAQRGALAARMSGSGATCFALFATAMAAEQAATTIRAARQDWWVASGQISAGQSLIS